MRFLIDADLPRSVAPLLTGRGHDARDVRDIGLGTSPDPEIAARALADGACLLTGDFDFADIRVYPPEMYPGIAVLWIPTVSSEAMILRLVEALLERTDVLERLPGRLVIVQPGRVRLRPA